MTLTNPQVPVNSALPIPFNLTVLPTVSTFLTQLVLSLNAQQSQNANVLNQALLGDTSGNIQLANMNSGTGATTLTFWRGDMTWATIPFPAAGNVTGPGTSTDHAIATWNGVLGTLLRNTGVIIDTSNDISGIVNLGMSGNATVGGTAAVTGTLSVTGASILNAVTATSIGMAANNVISLGSGTSGIGITYASATSVLEFYNLNTSAILATLSLTGNMTHFGNMDVTGSFTAGTQNLAGGFGVAYSPLEGVVVNPTGNAFNTTGTIVIQAGDLANLSAGGTTGPTGLEYAFISTINSTHGADALAAMTAGLAPAYASGTTYASNKFVSALDGGGNMQNWISLQAGNVGHTPATSPTWWSIWVAPNKVGGFFSASTNSTGGGIWSLNTVNTLISGAVTQTSFGYEVDVENASGQVRDYLHLGIGSYGIGLTGSGQGKNTAAIYIGGVSQTQAQWHSGMVFQSFRNTGTLATSSDYGIDLGFDISNTFRLSAINLPNSGAITSWLSGGSPAGIITGLKLNGSNIWEIGGGEPIAIVGATTPMIIWQPVSGATTNGYIEQTANSFVFGNHGINNWIVMDLIAGGTSFGSSISVAGAISANGNITIGGSVTPSLFFSPSSGASTTGVIKQNANNWIVGANGVGNYISLDLTTGNIAFSASMSIASTLAVTGDIRDTGNIYSGFGGSQTIGIGTSTVTGLANDGSNLLIRAGAAGGIYFQSPGGGANWMALTASVLNLFTQTGVIIGPGGTTSSGVSLSLNGSTAPNGGADILFGKGGSAAWGFGHSSAIFGTGSSTDLIIFNYSGVGTALTISYATNAVTFNQSVTSGGNFITTGTFVANNALGFLINPPSGIGHLTFDVGGTTVAAVAAGTSSIGVYSNSALTTGQQLLSGSSTWTTVSDARLPYKKSAKRVSILDKLNGVKVYRNTVYGHDELFGKAQELYEAFPQLVHVGDSDPDYEPTGLSDPRAWGIHYDRIGLVALAGLEELKARVAELEARQ